MALDIGAVRTGIAVSDAAGRVASPVKVLPTAEVRQAATSFRQLLAEYEPELLLAGLPISLDGVENQQAAQVREIAKEISTTTNLPLSFQDERLSSSEARRMLQEAGCTEKQMRGKIDMIAASIFLQTYLDAASVVDDS
jgi:putative Holliday junction resolvase